MSNAPQSDPTVSELKADILYLAQQVIEKAHTQDMTKRDLLRVQRRLVGILREVFGDT